jgi:hypothetical protein
MPPLSKSFRGTRRIPQWLEVRGFIIGLVLGVCVTTVFAAQMSLSATGLGTGSVAVTACDSTITIEIGHSYQTASTRFTISSITLSSVDVVCAAKTLVLVGYSGATSTLGVTTVLPASGGWPTNSAFTLAPGGTILSSAVTSTAIEIRD